MRIVRDNPLTKVDAISKINCFLNRLVARQFPAGVKIKNPQKRWQGNEMFFSFNVKKGFLLSVTINGTITVTEDKIYLSCSVPGIVATFVDEGKIKKVINDNFDELFGVK